MNQYLQENFADQCHLIQADIMHAPLTRQYDCILWLWAGVSDFNPIEQEKLIMYLSSHLNDGGSLVFDTADPSVFSVNIINQQPNKPYHFTDIKNDRLYHCYIPPI